MKRKPSKPLLAAIALVEVAIAVMTWRDIRRRPAEQIRGSKRFWRVVSVINPGNSIAYWLFGRRYPRPRRGGR